MTGSLAAQTLIEQELEISFDLAGQRLYGKSLISVPARTALTINLGGLEINGLALDGTEIPGRARLSVPPAAEKRRLAVSFQKTAAGLEGLISPEGISLTGVWHPLTDTPCLYRLTAVVPKHFSAISEADDISETLNGETRTLRFRFEHKLDSLSFVAGPYLVEQEPFGDGQTLYSFFFPEDRQLAALYRQKARGYLQRYQALLGPYPYRRYSVVENRLPTGYAMPTFTLLGQAVVRLPFISETALGHEVLHSWLGNAVEVNARQGNWSEGLTTYLADQAFAAEAGKGRQFRKQQLIALQSYASDSRAIPLLSFDNPGLNPGPESVAARAVGYEKASMVFHLLRREIGEDAFYAGLRSFYASYRNRQADWQELADSFHKSSGRDLAWFFSQWLKRKELPNLSLSVENIEEKEGQIILTLLLKQKQEQPFVGLPVSLEIRTSSGVYRQVILSSTAETRVVVELDDYPLSAIADPDYDLPRVLTPAEFPPVWSRFLGASEKLAIVKKGEEDKLLSPLLGLLASLNCPVISSDAVNEHELSGKALLFLGSDSPTVNGLFASRPETPQGFRLEVKENPLGRGQVAVLLSSASPEEVKAAAGKLKHYGKYSSLFFLSGENSEKKTTLSEDGILIEIDEAPRPLSAPKSQSFAAIIESLADRRAVYVGETHTRYADHLLQLKIIRALYRQNPKLAIGMEMFNRRSQPIIDRYLAGEINERDFLRQSGYFTSWGHDYRLYREIIAFAKRHQLRLVALNQDKEIVAKVYRHGVSALSDDELAMIPPERDLSLAGYRERLAEAFAMHKQPGPGKFNNFFQAQAIWDETMAESAANFLTANPGTRLVILAGRGHTDRSTGIPPRLARRLPGINQAVLVASEGEQLETARADHVFFSKEVELPSAPALGVMMINTGEGPQVADLGDKSKAGEAGIRKGDVILALDDEEVKTGADVKIILLGKKIGDEVNIRVSRESGLVFKSRKELIIPVKL